MKKSDKRPLILKQITSDRWMGLPPIEGNTIRSILFDLYLIVDINTYQLINESIKNEQKTNHHK